MAESDAASRIEIGDVPVPVISVFSSCPVLFLWLDVRFVTSLIRPSAGFTPFASLVSFALPHTRSGRGSFCHSLFPSLGSRTSEEPSQEGKTNRNQEETKMNTEIQEQLNQLALKRSIPFCYGCYREAPKDKCLYCGSDDFMRLLPGVGCEYGLC